ncbi:NAD(P)/FAD-dependent oxidoreductase [Candidatus Woesearchaeota archaeon]|nr:NAD(P)/FAD-dependent oxidoreductase [Candidatus Woesearchaeota archaeon]
MRISIIGAGPSGSYAAFLLANQGHDVHVFEEHASIGNPVQCTGIVTHAIWDLIPKNDSIIKLELDKVKIHAPNGTTVDFALKEFILDRAGLDKYIAQLAKKAGATYHLNHKFAGFDGTNIRVRHNGKEQTFPSDITIGADGPTSEVAKAADIWVPRKVWGGVQATIQGNYDQTAFDVFFGEEFKDFFAWVVPESKTLARIGIASEHKARDMFEHITKVYPGKLVGWQSGPIPIYDKNIPVQNKEHTVFLVGDAAGLVKATTGGGIITGMLSSKILAASIASDKDYAKALKPLRKDLGWHWLIRRTLNTFTDKDYNKLVNYMDSQKLQQLLKTHPRDFPTQFITKLFFVQPRFALFATNFIKQLLLPRSGVSNG